VNAKQLFRLPIGAQFEDYSGKQAFQKLAEVETPRGKRHQIQCIRSPFNVFPGPVCAAFFCAVGDVIFREGNLRVYPVETKVAT